MIEISDGFQFNDGKEDHKMMLYSAFFSYDELINCAIAGVAFLAGTSNLTDKEAVNVNLQASPQY